MMSGLRAAMIIAAGTFVEAMRNRLLVVSLLFAVVLVGASVSAASVSIGEQARLIIDVGLAAASAVGSLIAVSLAISSFGGEIRRHTAYAVLARPLPRWAFVLGKYLGLCAAVQLVVVLMGLATAGTVALYGEAVPPALWGALFFTLVEVSLVTALALLFSSMAVPTLAASYTIALVLAGNLAGDIRAVAERLIGRGQALGYLLRGGYYLLPDLQKLTLRSEAANRLPVHLDFLALGTAYATAYAVAALAVAMWIFSRRRAV